MPATHFPSTYEKSVCPRNFKSYRFWRLLSTHCAHRISTVYAHLPGHIGSSTGLPSFVYLCVLRGKSTTTKWARAKENRELFYAQQNAASACEAAPFRHQPKRKSANLIKDLVEVLAKNAKTLRGSLSPNETPWPGLISGFTCFLFDAGRATRDSNKTPS